MSDHQPEHVNDPFGLEQLGMPEEEKFFLRGLCELLQSKGATVSVRAVSLEELLEPPFPDED